MITDEMRARLPKKGDIISYNHELPNGEHMHGIGVVEEICGTSEPLIVMRGGPIIFPTLGDYWTKEEE